MFCQLLLGSECLKEVTIIKKNALNFDFSTLQIQVCNEENLIKLG